MFYEVPLSIIAVSVLAILFIVVRKVKNLPREVEENLVYPEVSEDGDNLSKYFSDNIGDSNAAEMTKKDLSIKKISTMQVQGKQLSSNKNNLGAFGAASFRLFEIFLKDNIASFAFSKVANFTRTFNKSAKGQEGPDIKISVPEKIKISPKNISKPVIVLSKSKPPETPTEVKLAVSSDSGVSSPQIREILSDIPKEVVAESKSEGVLDAEKREAPDFYSLKENNSEFDEQYWIGVLAQDPKSSFPYKKLSEIYVARGDYREARTVLKHALKMDPVDEEATKKLGELRGKRTVKRTFDI